MHKIDVHVLHTTVTKYFTLLCTKVNSSDQGQGLTTAAKFASRTTDGCWYIHSNLQLHHCPNTLPIKMLCFATLQSFCVQLLPISLFI